MNPVDAAGLEIGAGNPPRIMGVLNLSPDSPYDPSVFENPNAAAAYVDDSLIAEGADIVDIGLESANKRFDVREAEWELDRLDLAIDTIEQVRGDVVFSIETRYHEVAEAALDRGFDMVNDICGFADPKMPMVCRNFDAAVVKMASPPDLTRPGALSTVDDIYDALGRNGFTEKTIIDPAFGGWSAAKTTADDRETFRRLREFHAYDRPILVSINRKNFLREITDRSTKAALPVSLGATALAVERGADLIRTHDVTETRDAALIGHTFSRESVRDMHVRELDIRTKKDAERHLARLGLTTELAMESVPRTFAVTDLGPSTRDRLLKAAAGTGVSAAANDQRGFLAGSAAAFERFIVQLEGLDDIRETVQTAIK